MKAEEFAGTRIGLFLNSSFIILHFRYASALQSRHNSLEIFTKMAIYVFPCFYQFLRIFGQTFMRILMILLTCMIVGCVAQHSTPVAKKDLWPNGPTPEQIEQAKQRLHLLRPDMTVQQVHSTLGLKDSWFCWGDGGGPRGHFRINEGMWGGHSLFIVTGFTSKQVSGKTVQMFPLESVSLDGATWTDKNNGNN